MPSAKPPPRVFLLSPANAAGERAKLLLREQARFSLALRLREPSGISLGEAFSFTSGLYFRGKRVYARTFARPPRALAGAFVIVPGRGLVPLEAAVTRDDLIDFAQVPIDLSEPRYTEPLLRDAERLARRLGRSGEAVLLGSVASAKYTVPLLAALGERLWYPVEFVGRGDMSRGGLMLRAAATGAELRYQRVVGATLRGARPARLTKMPPALWTTVRQLERG